MSDALHLPPTIRVFERGWLSSNNVLFTGRDRVALVDSGYATQAEQTVALVRHVLGRRPLDLLVNTHLHSDHCGGNAALQAAFGCRTMIPAHEADKVRAWDEEALTYRATGQQCPRFGFDDVLRSGDVIELGDLAWQALAAPGHDPHSLILYCPEERLLLSADALWEHGFGVIFPELEGEPAFGDVRATLDLIASLDVRGVIPGHGAPFTGVEAALERAYSRIAYLAADPVRNAQNAVKVLLKFLLLERREIPLGDVPGMMAGIRLFVEANRRYLGMEEAALSDWAVAQLVKAGAAGIERGRLVDRG